MNAGYPVALFLIGTLFPPVLILLELFFFYLSFQFFFSLSFSKVSSRRLSSRPHSLSLILITSKPWNAWKQEQRRSPEPGTSVEQISLSLYLCRSLSISVFLFISLIPYYFKALECLGTEREKESETWNFSGNTFIIMKT